MGKTPFAYPDNRDPIWQGAWYSALMWAIGKPEAVAAFEKDTGQRLPTPPANGLEALIDKATGANEVPYVAFINWFNENVWGADGMVSPLFRPEPPAPEQEGR